MQNEIVISFVTFAMCDDNNEYDDIRKIVEIVVNEKYSVEEIGVLAREIALMQNLISQTLLERIKE